MMKKITIHWETLESNKSVNDMDILIEKSRISMYPITKIRFTDFGGEPLQHEDYSENLIAVTIKRLFATKPTYIYCEYDYVV